MILSWLRNRRRRELRVQPFPEEWLHVLQVNVRIFGLLTEDDQKRLQERIKVFVPEKDWVGCNGLEITDEIRVTIASQACLLLLGVEDDYCFDDLRSVLVYPAVYTQPEKWREHDTLVDKEVAMFGEAWHRGPIVLTWPEALRGGQHPEQGHLLVIHEFAHHVDGLEGGMDGTPPLRSRQEYRRWDQVVEEEYQRLVRQAEAGRATLLDQYGASSRAEFFAVACECFFGRPIELRQRHPDLYDLLRILYRQDPAEWPGHRAGPGRSTR